MNKKEMMGSFINKIYDKKLMTLFIRNLFDYNNFYDYNYIFRMKEDKKRIIIDIYDNVSSNRFNRYIFSFTHGEYDIRIEEDKNVFVSYINVLDLNDSDNKLKKLGYLFNIKEKRMVDYAETFLDDEIVNCLIEVLNEKSKLIL